MCVRMYVWKVEFVKHNLKFQYQPRDGKQPDQGIATDCLHNHADHTAM